MRTLVVTILAFLLAGCALVPPLGKPAPKPATPASQPTDSSPAADAQEPAASVVRVVIYQLDAPLGRISANEEFWKRVDEQGVDPVIYDLLFRNGLRVGRASSADWDFFRKFLDQVPASAHAPLTFTGVEGKAIELEMKTAVPSQTVFDFDSLGHLSGRTFNKADNILSIWVMPSPSHRSHVRISAYPLIRSLKRELRVLTSGEEYEIQEVRPERYFDLNLRIDLPTDHFLVIAPSPQARWSSSLGQAFLINGGQGENFERLLLVVPHVHKAQVQAVDINQMSVPRPNKPDGTAKNPPITDKSSRR